MPVLTAVDSVLMLCRLLTALHQVSSCYAWRQMRCRDQSQNRSLLPLLLVVLSISGLLGAAGVCATFLLLDAALLFAAAFRVFNC
jgi:hypothetical protein